MFARMVRRADGRCDDGRRAAKHTQTSDMMHEKWCVYVCVSVSEWHEKRGGFLPYPVRLYVMCLLNNR